MWNKPLWNHIKNCFFLVFVLFFLHFILKLAFNHFSFIFCTRRNEFVLRRFLVFHRWHAYSDVNGSISSNGWSLFNLIVNVHICYLLCHCFNCEIVSSKPRIMNQNSSKMLCIAWLGLALRKEAIHVQMRIKTWTSKHTQTINTF